MSATRPTPISVLIDLLTNLLAPLFLVASNGDIRLARDAAVATMNAYRIESYVDLVTVAQLVAFSLGALGSLALSMGDDLSLSMILRLRGNANACSRSAEQHRRALDARHQAQAAPSAAAEPRGQPAAAEPRAPQPQPPATPPAASRPAAPQSAAPATPTTADQQHRAMWAAAFNEVAAECTAEIPHLPPAERKAASIRAAALNSSATALLSGVDLEPYRLGPLTPPKGVKPR